MFDDNDRKSLLAVALKLKHLVHRDLTYKQRQDLCSCHEAGRREQVPTEAGNTKSLCWEACPWFSSPVAEQFHGHNTGVYFLTLHCPH